MEHYMHVNPLLTRLQCPHFDSWGGGAIVLSAPLSAVTAAGVCSVPDRCTRCLPLLLLGCRLTRIHCINWLFWLVVCEWGSLGRRTCAADRLTGISKVDDAFSSFPAQLFRVASLIYVTLCSRCVHSSSVIYLCFCCFNFFPLIQKLPSI